MPALVSCTVPAFWGWLNRALELGTVQHGGISMREWHGWVGSVISIIMLFRTLIPQLPDLLAVLWRVCRRRLRARKTISQEDLRELYVNPQRLGRARKEGEKQKHVYIRCMASVWQLYTSQMHMQSYADIAM